MLLLFVLRLWPFLVAGIPGIAMIPGVVRVVEAILMILRYLLLLGQSFQRRRSWHPLV
ncbi:hypothetical protein NSMM_230037 [Nitrosomonas mobilis]|uniref:Uncharacterized protein n=1 Tax=Nitrosomonas mobilis TaxID=51642 RepID=A0A1G5SBR9_9PROT|nr:hypothetical protein NSMM_230037 [Nitrosomonas mobilis]